MVLKLRICHLRVLLRHRFLTPPSPSLAGFWRLKICIYNKFPGDAEAVGVLRQAMCVWVVGGRVLHVDYCFEQ